ncbi:MAG: MbnH family di-heme enzyme [Desulfobacterales bacterium]
MLSVIGCDYGLKLNRSAIFDRENEYVWQIPEGFPIPVVPADNPMTWSKVELGRELFYDSRLSGDGTISCASCHQPELAFTDGRSRAVGIQGNIHPRSAMTLTNVAYNATLGWDDPTLTRLEDQILVPLYNTQPPEMGAAGREAEILSRLKNDRRLRRLFHGAFPDDKYPVTMRNVIFALAAFERTLISGNTPYDRWAYGAEPDALDGDQRAGARLFFSRRLKCFRCHAGFNLSGPVKYEGSELPSARFHNTALHNEDGTGAYPIPNTGLHRHTGRRDDMGKFRAPTLRNIALTAPYMHDGSIATLEEVLDHYAVGGRSRTSTQIKHPISNTDPFMTGFEISPLEKRQLIAFLHALTDQNFIQQSVQ